MPEQQTEQIAARVTATWAEEVMADKFRALLATKDSGPQSVAITELTESDLMDGEVTVAVEHSTVNYKDGLAITGKVPSFTNSLLSPASIWPEACCIRMILASRREIASR